VLDFIDLTWLAQAGFEPPPLRFGAGQQPSG
jgi:hypothetical protein